MYDLRIPKTLSMGSNPPLHLGLSHSLTLIPPGIGITRQVHTGTRSLTEGNGDKGVIATSF